MSSDNYIQDVEYPSYYNPNLNPLSLWFTAATNGFVERPMPGTFRYCDLGCGIGTTLIYLASMYPQAHFVGVDFNADHINSANELAKKAQLSNIEFHQLDFADLESWNIEGFDFTVCFGAFSWINLSLQNSILSFVANKLNTGGIFLVHYAARPGKVQIDPLWHLMRTVTESVPGNSIDRVQEGMKIVSQLKSGDAAFFKLNPVAAHRAQALTGQNLNYVAHESLTEWQAFFHSDIAQRAGEYGLTFAGPSGQANVALDFRVPHAFKSLFNDSIDTVVTETLCDYIHNTGVRLDVFVKDVRRETSNLEQLEDAVFGITPLISEAIPPQVNSLSGKSVNLNNPIPKTILEGVKERSMTFREIASQPALSNCKKNEIRDMLSFLVSIGAIQPLANHYPSTPPGNDSQWEPTLPLTRNELASDFPIDRPLNLPSAHTGQCTPLPPMIALILAALENNIPQNELVNLVADKLMQAKNPVFANNPNPPGKQELVKAINGQLSLLSNKTLPRLAAKGVYRVINSGS
jgi:SAM-dependent methyltransferase